jgi:acyl-CoA dehydrogenase
MYSFDPNEEQQMLVEAVSRYARTDLRPAAHEAEEVGALPTQLIGKGWELGLLQASIPETYGGFGERSAVTGVLAEEELAFGDLAAAFTIGTPGLFAYPLLMAGTEQQKKDYLPKVIESDWRPFSAALIEYDFDFDPNNLRTTAKKIGEEIVLHGEKAFVPFAKDAEALIVYANLDGKTQGFILPKGTAGLTVEDEREKLMGLNALPLYRVKLKDVNIPTRSQLGGNAGHDFEAVLASMHVASASAAVGLAKAALEYSRDYAKEREAFGVKIAQKQAIAFMLAEMATEIEAVRMLTWEAAWKLDTGKQDGFIEAYLAYTGAVDMVMMVTDRAVQILGGHGYIREHPVELWMRNGRGFAMFTGLTMV